MTRNISIYCLGILCWLAACKNSKSASSDIFLLAYQGKAFTAWNEETVHSYQIALTTGKKFYYAIVRKESLQKTEEYYKGTFKFSGDTIFMNYFKGLRPAGVTNYLMVESSRHYLIQPFTNDARRMFLRIQKIGHLL